VTLAKQAVLSHPPTEKGTEKKRDTILFDFKDEEEEEEKADKIKPAPLTTDKEEEKAEEKEKKEENYEGMEEWEIELRKAAII
jgi:hypothetical protein